MRDSKRHFPPPQQLSILATSRCGDDFSLRERTARFCAPGGVRCTLARRRGVATPRPAAYAFRSTWPAFSHPENSTAPRLRLSLFPAVSLAALLAVARGLSAVRDYQVHRRRALRRALDVERVARLRTLCLRFVQSRAVMAKRMRTRYASDVVRGVPCRWRGGCAGVKRSVRP